MFNLFEAAKRSRNPLAAGLMKGVVTEDQFFAVLPMVPRAGDSFSYTREKTLPTVAWVAADGSDSVSESHADFDQVVVPKRRIASNVDVDNFAEENQTENGRPSALQILQKFKAAGRELADKLINGKSGSSHALVQSTNPFNAIDAVVAGPHLDSDRFGPGEIKYTHTGTLWQFRAPGDRTFGPAVAAASDGDYTLKSDNPSKYVVVTLDVSDASQDGRTSITFTLSKEPDGLKVLCAPSQKITPAGANGDDIQFETLDKLKDTVKRRGDLVFIANSAAIRKIKALYRNLGGTAPNDVVNVPSFARDGSPTETPILAYDGIPIFKNDNIKSDETVGGSGATLTSIYCVSLAFDEGLWAGCMGGATFDVETDPRKRNVMGFRLTEIGELETKDARRWRLAWYGAFALGSDLALARASGLKV